MQSELSGGKINGQEFHFPKKEDQKTPGTKKDEKDSVLKQEMIGAIDDNESDRAMRLEDLRKARLAYEFDLIKYDSGNREKVRRINLDTNEQAAWDALGDIEPSFFAMLGSKGEHLKKLHSNFLEAKAEMDALSTDSTENQ